MALLHESVDFKKLDTRMVERNITRGQLTREQYQKALKELPDDAENADWVSLEDLADEGQEIPRSNGKASQPH